MGHRVTADELDDWVDEENEQWKRFAGSHNAISDKHFEVNIRKWQYIVMDHGVIIYEGTNKSDAINAYNAAR